jgi:hypothetical protein
LSQLAKGAVQLWIAHVVTLHTGLPFCTAQTAPQAPQLLTSLRVTRSQPSLTAALQFAKPVLHVMEHEPFRHFGVPFVASHASPQPPQLATEFEVSVSQPFDATPSQSA